MESQTSNMDDLLPPLKEYAWDFVHNKFRYRTDGIIQIVEENEALKIWIYKALKTERYRYEAYLHGVYNLDSNYGIELEKYIGVYPNNSRTATIIEQRIRECLSINPYIKNINYIRIDDMRKDNLIISLGLTSIYGNLEQIYKL
jgi:hypothetical protein